MILFYGIMHFNLVVPLLLHRVTKKAPSKEGTFLFRKVYTLIQELVSLMLLQEIVQTI